MTTTKTPQTPCIQQIYTDGACSGNPGKGGWGTVIYFNDRSVCELGGMEPETTNNRMEMQAAIAGLEFLAQSRQTQSVTLYTDSEYVKNGITQWIRGWKNKNWKTSTGKPVLNRDLWEILDRLNSSQIRWEYVRGHSGNEGNERCDTIARNFAQGRTPSLQQPKSLQFNSSPTLDRQSPTALDSNGFAPISKERPIAPKLNLSSDRIHNPANERLQSTSVTCNSLISQPEMTDLTHIANEATLDNRSSASRIDALRDVLESLCIADEIAEKGYLISSSELADLIDVNASAVTSRGDHWVWRNWVVSRVRREGNQILWQLERVD
ncbi:MAG: ribonuclease HI [Geitlerinemataceae cyanobacterium]